MEGGAGLDLVASIGTLNDDAALRRVAGAPSSVDQESRAAAHAVRASRVQVVAIVHTLESAHVTKGVGALRKGADGDLALARRVVAAAAGLTAAGTVSIDLTTVERGTVKMVSALRVSVWSTSGDIVLLEELFLGAWRSAHTYSTTSL
jgi:hypothetical protein